MLTGPSLLHCESRVQYQDKHEILSTGMDKFFDSAGVSYLRYKSGSGSFQQCITQAFPRMCNDIISDYMQVASCARSIQITSPLTLINRIKMSRLASSFSSIPTWICFLLLEPGGGFPYPTNISIALLVKGKIQWIY